MEEHESEWWTGNWFFHLARWSATELMLLLSSPLGCYQNRSLKINRKSPPSSSSLFLSPVDDEVSLNCSQISVIKTKSILGVKEKMMGRGGSGTNVKKIM